MRIEHKNPKKKEGVFVWEAEVMFFPQGKHEEFMGKGEKEICETLRGKYGQNSICFPSSGREDTFLVWITKIKEWEEQKKVNASYNILERKTYEDKEHGNVISIFDFSDGIVGKKQIKSSFSFEFSEAEIVENNWEAEDYDRGSSIYRKYTKSEARIGKTDEVVRYAAEIAKERGEAPENAKKIYDWVVKNISCREDGRRKREIARVFEDKEGSVKEVNLLFIVLLRAVGIPARAVSGAQGRKRQNLHFWTEFYLEDVGWIPADPDKKMFGKLDNERVVFSKGENIYLEKAPEKSEVFGIKYKRVLSMQPDALYIDKKERGFFVIRKSKYLLIKEDVKW